MALKKRKPGLIVRKAEQRLKGMTKIDSLHKKIINYGGFSSSLSSKELKNQINLCKSYNSDYNEALQTADEKSAILKESESKLTEMYSRILSGCISVFGGDAQEISLLGGTRKSDRKKSKRKKVGN